MFPNIPANRIVAFAGPYFSAAAGGIASWLVAKVNIAGLPGLDQNNVKTAIAGGFTWLLVAGLTWAGHSKWLTGHHIQMEADARTTAAAIAVAAAPATTVVTATPLVTAGNGNGNGNGHGSVEEAAQALESVDVQDVATEPNEGEDSGPPSYDGLPTDEEELSSPPTPAAYTPAEPVSA
jgi:hypothetical protein